VAETKYSEDVQRFDCLGLDLNRPVDSVKQAKFPILQNVRSFLAGRIEPRDGLYDTGAVNAGSPTHSARRLNDPSSGNWTRILGGGTKLYSGQGPVYNLVDSNYSGDPLAMVPWRTDASPLGFMYVADRSRMRKTCITQEVHTIGLPPPLTAPQAVMDKPLYMMVDRFQHFADWAPGGPNAPTGVSGPDGGGATVDRASSSASGTNPPVPGSTHIKAIVYDNAVPGAVATPWVTGTGWASVLLTNMVGTGKGQILDFNELVPANADLSVLAHDVFAGDNLIGGTSTAQAITGILYDAGAAGPASMQLAAPLQFALPMCLLYNVTKNEYFQALAVIGGPDKTTSFRVSTVLTFTTGDQVVVVPSLRVFLVHNHVSGETVDSNAIGATFKKGTGWITKDLTPFGSPYFDFSQLSATNTPPAVITPTASRPVTSDDYMHIGIIVDHPENISEIKIQLYIDSVFFAGSYDFNGDPVHNPGGGNYYSKVFRAADITPSTQNKQPILTSSGTIIQNQQLQNPQAPTVNSQPLKSGNNQWCDLQFPMSDILRVGPDGTRTWQNVTKLQILVTIPSTAPANNGNTVILFNGWWVGGGYNPDTFDPTAINYQYRYRARVQSTNVPSNWSPAMLNNVDPERLQNIVTLPNYPPPLQTTMVTTDFVLDIQRYGGELAQWRYIATVPNGGTPTYIDNLGDDTVAVLPADEQDHWQPWATQGLVVSGTATSVVGITVLSAGQFNLSWAPGTIILINGTPFTIYQVISTSMLLLVESANALTNVPWRIDEPTLQNQNLPCLWGDEQLGAMFACGDPNNPGRLYFSNIDDPDTTTDANYIDITSTSEPLMNGVVYNIRSYVFSSERMFQILATGDPTAPWRAQEIPNGKGLFSRWALTVHPTPVICFLSKDGLNATTGGAPQALTDADLYEYFPNEGNVGSTVNGIAPPNVTLAHATDLRLEYYDEFLYFDFVDTNGVRTTLALAFDLGAVVRGEAPGGWFYDVYTPPGVFHYGEEGPSVHSLLLGATDGHLYQYAIGMSDAGNPINCIVQTGSRDQGDPRNNKLYGDIMLDADTAGVPITCTPLENNGLTALPSVIVNATPRQQTSIPLGTQWQEAKNLALRLTWQITAPLNVASAPHPYLFIWEARYTFSAAPLSSTTWSMSASSLGLENWKHIALVRVARVSGIPVTLSYVMDGVAQPPITIPSSGGAYDQVVFRVPVQKFKLIQATINGPSEFRLDTRDTYFDLKEWGSDGEYRGFRLLGDFSMVEG